MTACLAIEYDGGVLLACDSFLGTDDVRDETPSPKWWCAGPLVVGYAGGLTIPQAMARAPRAPRRRPGEPAEALVQRYAARLHAAHRAARVALDETDYVIAYAGVAWVVQPDASVARSARGYVAIGAGADYALGSLATTRGAPARRAKRALVAAARHCAQVAPPYRAVEVPHDR